MSIKVKGPKVDPETQARQRQAEQRAEAGRIEATQEGVSEETRSVIRQFGRLAAFSGSRSLASVGLFQGSGDPLQSLPFDDLRRIQINRTSGRIR